KLTSLSSWLHGVALRVSLKLRARLARAARSIPERRATADREPPGSWNELSAALDEELQRLPEKFRAPLVLCYLQARTRDEAARAVEWKLDTLKGRLEWGRKLLRQRLTRRGLALGTALSLGALCQPATAGVSAPCAIAIVRSAVSVAAGKPLEACGASPQVVDLVQVCLPAALVRRLQAAAGALAPALVLP